MGTSNGGSMSISRRTFLRDTVLFGSGLALTVGIGAAASAAAPDRAFAAGGDGNKIGDSYDVIVVGAGGGGMEAALTAANSGLDVAIFEKEGRTGGDTALSDGTIHAIGTSFQKEQGYDVGSIDDYIAARQDPESKFDVTDHDLVKTLIEGATTMVEELSKAGIEFNPIADWDPWAHTAGGAGAAIADYLATQIDVADIPLFLETPVVSLVTGDTGVQGVSVKTSEGLKQVQAKAVILATGGFYNSDGMKNKYTPGFLNMQVVGSSGSEGDGIVMGQRAGASCVALDSGLHTYIVTMKTLKDLSYPMGSSSGIFVNMDGDRFINEDAHYDKAGKACISQRGDRGYFIFDDKSRSEYDLLEAYFDQGVVDEFASLEEVAAAYGLANLIDTVNHYNEMVSGEADSDFGRSWPLEKIDGDKYYAIEGVGCVYFSYGGLDIDTSARVLDESGEPIPGLYACGETIASPEFREGLVYTSGISAGYVFGKIAAQSIPNDLGL